MIWALLIHLPVLCLPKKILRRKMSCIVSIRFMPMQTIPTTRAMPPSSAYRVDKTDLFGADPKYRGRPLWSAGASWNLQNEDFMKGLKWIDVLKLRASYGLTGNIDQSVSSYLTAAIAVNDINSSKGATLNTPPNDQLRWEKTASWNVGVDFSFIGNRLSGGIDWYYKKSTDLLSLTDIDPTTGWTSAHHQQRKST